MFMSFVSFRCVSALPHQECFLRRTTRFTGITVQTASFFTTGRARRLRFGPVSRGGFLGSSQVSWKRVWLSRKHLAAGGGATGTGQGPPERPQAPAAAFGSRRTLSLPTLGNHRAFGQAISSSGCGLPGSSQPHTKHFQVKGASWLYS